MMGLPLKTGEGSWTWSLPCLLENEFGHPWRSAALGPTAHGRTGPQTLGSLSVLWYSVGESLRGLESEREEAHDVEASVFG